MNCNELKKRLEKHNIAQHRYSIMGEKYPNESLCIIYEDSLWKVYYGEKGRMSGLKKFKSESEACEYFYNLIMSFRT